ncbi:MAG: hypothetical protein GY804_04575 [Alphaproteobacteria bacterium]|nr:hypothetical protein [Alphaproteobacteria bacterium]
MATGDILSISINPDGWAATIKVEGVGVGGVYDFGLGVNNDPLNAKIKLALTSQGYNSLGVLTTTTREIYGVPCITNNTGAIRKAYPNQTEPQESVNGSDVDIVVALSDYIYSADTIITADLLSGWYTQGTPSNSATGLSVTNNSAANYPKPIGSWADPGYSLKTGDFDVEFTSFHRDGIAAVRFTAFDGVTTVTNIVTDLTVSEKPDYNKVLVYANTFDVSTLNDGLITVNAEVFPKVGNVSSILYTGDGANTWPTPLYTSQTYRLDTANSHGFLVVDPTNGNDGTGAVYSSQVLAEAGSAYQTISTALIALQAYHNANAGHNDAGGGVVLCTEDTHTLRSSNGGTLSEWVEVKPTSTAIRENTIFEVTALSSIPTLLKFSGITTTGTSFWNGSNTKNMWFDQVAYQATGAVSAYTCPASFVTHCVGTFPNGFLGYSATATAFAIVRGNDFVVRHSCVAYTVLGNRNVNCIRKTAVNTCPIQNNVVYAFNKFDDSDISVQINMSSVDNITGLAIVQNLMIRYGSQIQPLIQISADETTTTTANVLLWNNSIIGARSNLGYNDTVAGGPYAQDLWSLKNNIISRYSNKDDTFGDNPLATGSWPVGYSVGAEGNLLRTSPDAEWFGEFQGLWMKKGTPSVPLEPLYINDQSADGGDTSGGDYHLQASSPAIDLSHERTVPYDLEGKSRVLNGSSGVYESASGQSVLILRRRMENNNG